MAGKGSIAALRHVAAHEAHTLVLQLHLRAGAKRGLSQGGVYVCAQPAQHV